MDMRFLPKLGPAASRELIRNCLAQLHKDYDLNLEEKMFDQMWKDPLSFEEFLVMMMLEKDALLKFIGGKT